MKKAFVCIDSLRKKLDEDPEFFKARSDYDLFVTTIPVTRQDVADFRLACPNAELAAYIDPFHLRLVWDGVWWEWIGDLPEERWLMDATTKQPVIRFPERGFYVHTGITARMMARECALLCAKVGINRMFFDDYDQVMGYRYDKTAQGVTRRLRWGGGVQPYQKLRMDYVIAARQILVAFENEFGPKSLPIVNSGLPWIGDSIPMGGRSQEGGVNAETFKAEAGREHNYAIAYPWTIAGLRAMIADGTFPDYVGIMEDRLMPGPV